MLNVNDVTPDDAGQYSCVAKNAVGMASTIGELHVQELGWRRRSVDPGTGTGTQGSIKRRRR